MRQAFFVAALFLGIANDALAQSATPPTPPTVLAFREYRAAIEKGDLNAANVAGERAWRLAERDGSAPDRIAVLAFNLAQVRAQLEPKAQLIEPAERALALVDSGAKGVDRDALRLLIGEGLLAKDYARGKPAMLDALAQARLRGGALNREIVVASRALAEAAARAQDSATSLAAWDDVALHATGDPADIVTTKAEAGVGRGIALAALGRDEEARTAFRSAMQAYAPGAAERADGKITVDKIRYAHALAWSAGVAARMRSQGKEPTKEDPVSLRQLPDLPPLCKMKVSAKGIEFPAIPSARGVDIPSADAFSNGAAVFQLQIDAEGKILKRTLLASIPLPTFGKAADARGAVWQVSPETTVVGCRVATNDLIVPVHFALQHDFSGMLNSAFD